MDHFSQCEFEEAMWNKLPVIETVLSNLVTDHGIQKNPYPIETQIRQLPFH